MEKTYYVYRHISKKDNNTFYIGKGKNNRAFETGKGRHSKEWEKFAELGYSIELIETELTEDEAFFLEALYIEKYKTLGMANANVTLGGKGINVKKRWWGNKISKALVGIKRPIGKLNKSYKDNITKDELYEMYVNKGMNTTQIGELCGLSYATISKRLKKHNIDIKKAGKKSIKIKCLNDGKVFNSITSAAKHYSIHRENISKVLKGKYNHTGGYKFIKI